MLHNAAQVMILATQRSSTLYLRFKESPATRCASNQSSRRLSAIVMK